MNKQQLQNIAEFVIAEAKRLGATDSSVSISASTGLSTSVRMGQVESLMGTNDEGLSLTVWVGNRSASTSTSDFRRRQLTKAIRNTLKVANQMQPDECSGLAEEEHLAKFIPDLDLADSSLTTLTPEAKIDMAMEAESIGLTYSNSIKMSEGATFDDSVTTKVKANSRGFFACYDSSVCVLYAVLVAESADMKKSGYWYRQRRFLNELPSAQMIGEKSAQDALQLMGAVKAKSQSVPVIYSPNMASNLVSTVVGAASGTHAYRKSSYLAKRLGEEIASKLVTIVSNPLIPRALGSSPFDSNSMPSLHRNIVEDGRLKTQLIGCYSARKLKVAPNSASTGNLQLVPGDSDPKDIIASVKNGLYLTGTVGNGFNVATGDYSVGAEGIWIENGELTYPVHEITIAGNLLDMMKSIEAVGNDSEAQSSVSAPTVLIGNMTVAGT